MISFELSRRGKLPPIPTKAIFPQSTFRVCHGTNIEHHTQCKDMNLGHSATQCDHPPHIRDSNLDDVQSPSGAALAGLDKLKSHDLGRDSSRGRPRTCAVEQPRILIHHAPPEPGALLVLSSSYRVMGRFRSARPGSARESEEVKTSSTPEISVTCSAIALANTLIAHPRSISIEEGSVSKQSAAGI